MKQEIKSEYNDYCNKEQDCYSSPLSYMNTQYGYQHPPPPPPPPQQQPYQVRVLLGSHIEINADNNYLQYLTFRRMVNIGTDGLNNIKNSHVVPRRVSLVRHLFRN